MGEDMSKRIAQYIMVRDAIKKMNEEHEAKLQPLLDIQEVLSGRVQAFLNNNKLDSLKTEHGTCYLSTRYSASVQDGEAFMNFVKDGHWDMIERRANPTAVKDYVKEHNTLPSGVNLTAVQTVGVRRPTGK